MRRVFRLVKKHLKILIAKHNCLVSLNTLKIYLFKRPLGNLNYLKIWHDNSGKGDKASWFLKYIIVRDLQTREKFYFLCNDWLAVEHGDGKLERGLFIALDKQKTN